MRRVSIAILLAVSLLVWMAGPAALAADFPTKPINMIVGFAAGGGTDIQARTLVPYVEKHLGTTIAVVNRPGANGTIAFTAIANATPDGYTIGVLNLPDVFLNIYTSGANYKPEDFRVIAFVGGSSHAIGVRADSPFQTLNDLVEYAKANPNALTVGSAGRLGNDELALLDFAQKAGIEVTAVPFTGAAPARTALLGGHIGALSFNVEEAVTFVQAGRIRLLGVMSEQRIPQVPDVPTFREQGFDVISSSARVVVAPAGIPDDVLAILREAFAKGLAEPGLAADFEKNAVEYELQDPEETQRHLIELAGQVEDILRKAGVID